MWLTVIIILLVISPIWALIHFFQQGHDSKSGPETFAIGSNKYRYLEAQDICQKIGTRIATRAELLEAQKSGAAWNNLGWIKGIAAYYPTSQKLVGGRMPSQLKLGAVCYGYKPKKNDTYSKELLIQPWNPNRWSKN